MGGELRVNSGSEKISAVLTDTCGTSTTYHGSSGYSGVSFSPTPSAKAACPCTKTGTSAPSVRPSVARRSRSQPSCHKWFRPSSVVAAFELPPPMPPPMGRTLSIQMSMPSVQPDHGAVAYGGRQFTDVVEKLKQRLQLVVAVFTAPQNVQHQIEFGRGGQGQFLYAHVIAPACAVASP